MNSLYPLVYIKWEDHWAQEGSWIPSKKLLKKHLENEGVYMETVGFLVNETERSVLLVLSVSSDGQTDGNIVILKKTILERKVLKP